MALIVLTSSRGAPGVTTTALALALLWPRPTVMVEADVSGSSSVAAGYLRGTIGPQHGLINLAVAHRAGTLTPESIREQAVALTDDGPRLLVPALANADQVGSMTEGFWERLGAMLTALGRVGTDVIVDAGRAGASNGPEPLFRCADMVLLVARTSLDAVVSARARVGQLRGSLADSIPGVDALCLLLVGDGRPHRAGDVSKAVGLPVIATISFDEANAQVLSHGAPRSRRFDTSPLVRSIRSAADEIQRAVAARHAHLAPPLLADEEVHEEHAGARRSE
jgi:hypothetical protein